MLQEKDALTDETFNSLQQGTKVRFKWHGSDLLYEGRIEVDKRGDIYFVNEHNYKDDVLINEGMRYYNELRSFFKFTLFEVFSK